MRFALLGAAGYVAPRHMAAIRDVGGDLAAAFDPNDSVGVLDSYFPNAEFFTELEPFRRHLAELRRRGRPIDCLSICSPNHLHVEQCRLALEIGADAICEKPLALHPGELDELARLERGAGRRISTIMQLRLHPAIKALKRTVAASGRRHSVDLAYITSRGRWYHASWKGQDPKSGGLVTNIGVHLFDMVADVFGPPRSFVVHLREAERASGVLECERADVRWFLSVDRNDLPAGAKGKATTYRSLMLDGDAVEFSDGFADLHTESYREILAGRGFRIDDVRSSIEIVSALRQVPVVAASERHPLPGRLAS
jgi:UDP-N-acetyl-2-amino-2-deoxyglucuronate dehydrogenase